MNIALIGASGFVGSAILKEAVSRGHQVKAIVRNPGKVNQPGESVVVTECDVIDTEKLAEVLKGSDAVISAYNPGWTNPAIYDDFIEGAKSIQEAVRKSGVKRLIVVGGAGSLFIAPGVQLIDTPEFPSEIKAGASAGRDYLNILQKEDQLDWTFLSPAIEMHPGTSGLRKGVYRAGLDYPVYDEQKRSVISVEDIAVALLDETEDPEHIGRRFTVAY